jgi:hypothetical protein
MVKYIIFFLCVLTLDSQANMHRRARHFNARDAGATLVLDSRFITGLSDGDPVSTWSDRSGNGNDATGSGDTRPTFQAGEVGGQPAIEFDGSNDKLNITISLTQPTYALIVFNSTGTKFYHRVWAESSNSMNLDCASGIFTDGLTIYAGAALVASTTTTTTLLADVEFNGSSSTIRKNGTLIASGNAGSGSAAAIELGGATIAGASQAFSGKMSTVIFLPSSPSSAKAARLRHAAAYSFKIPCN